MLPRALALLLVLAIAACGASSALPESREAGRLGSVQLWRPAGAPSALVFLFSDTAGWSAGESVVAAHWQARGAAVVGVDLATYLAALRTSSDGCHYLISELEELSKRLQREFGSAVYHSPILAGVGAGGTLAYAALAQAPAATVAGAVLADPAPALATKVPLCPGASAQSAAGGGFRYAEQERLPGFLVRAAAGSEPATIRLGRAVDRALDEVASVPSPLRDLPLVELPSHQPGAAMAVIYSGDGGWRDLDKSIGEWLAGAGVSVVGVDSLRYFWHAKTPERVAEDLAGILQHYGSRWQRSQVALIGYSFGAGVVPFAMNRLPPAERARVVQVSLLGLESRAPFEFHVSGWFEQFGVQEDPRAAAPLVLPELLQIDLRLVQCVYGEDEAESLCRAPELAAAERIRTRGGHHFDGDYPTLAKRILDGIERRSAHRVGAP